ncbi:aristolochene synthase prx2 [Hirsutella rhossiliensis]|uniref:Terpene synthase n=1 Tax=Hirsutella rhossiliensis TaxID=111463 RepID=A0A9P8SFY8_9HYPO|nr:aristolochene synthase prx2 [Hirsutella rhossiliensis]KAH0959496.1 aristolochene synthase prx2 [Hirsutella rhossiliensis]
MTEHAIEERARAHLPTDVPIYASLSVKRYAVQSPPPSTWVHACHHLVGLVSQETDDWFLQNWPFPNDKARHKFVAAGYSQLTCLYYPLARDDRIHFACRLLAILFLLDDLLEDMSFDEGEKYNATLILIARGDVLPNRAVPAEYMFYDLWESMRTHDKDLANEVLEPTFVFMRAQTDRSRKEISELGQYLEYRERDVGKALLSALMRFVMGLHLTVDDIEEVKLVERNCAKHISVVNDIFSWEKELRQSEKSSQDGSVLCSAVKVLADSTSLGAEASKTCLWTMVREWEVKHEVLCAELCMDAGMASELKVLYLKGLEYQMSGNEYWSRTTPRYWIVD